MQGLMDWIFVGRCPLPPKIEHFDIQCMLPHNLAFNRIRYFPLSEERRIIIGLSKVYPSLQKITLNRPAVWKRFGNSWREPLAGGL